MMTQHVPLTAFLALGLIAPALLQEIQTRHYRPLPDKCDRYGRCSPKEGAGYIEEVDDYRPEKQRPAVLTRDDYPARPLDDKEIKPHRDEDTSYGGHKPRDEVVKPSGGERPTGAYDAKPPRDRDEDIKPSGGGRPSSAYDPKPPRDRDEDVKPSGGGRPASGGGYGGGYKPADRDGVVKPSGGGGRPSVDVYDPKPPRDVEEDTKPSGGRPGGYGGHKPRDEVVKPSGGGRPTSVYDPKPPRDVDEDLKPSRRPASGGGYKPKPADREDDIKPPRGRPDYGYDSDEDLKPFGGYDPKRDEDIKPSGGRPDGGHGYKPRPDRDEDLKPPRVGRPGGLKPPGRGVADYDRRDDGYRGSYDPKPEDDRKPTRGRPSVGDYDIKPSGGGNRGGQDDGQPGNEDYSNDYGSDGMKPVSVVEGNCICVPYYQCTDGHIVTDGAGIIDARKRPEPKPDDELPLDGKFKPPSCGPYHVCCNTPESSTVRPYEHRCGVRNPSGINSRILSPSNKGEADFGEWPWQAAVLKSEGKVNIFQCGGVLIDKYHVLTVAHCVFHLYHLPEYPLKVRLGEWDTQTTTEFLSHEDYKVSKIVVHPEYRNTSLWNDIAVLRLQDPVLFAPHIDTVCLPQYDEAFAGQNCVVTGWGKDAYKGGTFSNVMKEVALQVIDNYKCEEMLRKTRLGRFFQLHEGFLCAGGEYGIDSCKGDGGGPLVCYRKDKSYALAGLVSWGIDCGQPEVPGVYVKIQKYLPWISKTTGVELHEYWPKQ